MLTAGLALLMAAAAPPAAPEIHCKGHEDNLATYQAISKILFNDRDASRAGEFYADEFISHNSDLGGSEKMVSNPANMTRMWNKSLEEDPNRELIDNLIICKDDFVIAQVTLQGDRAGETLKGKPEGRQRFRASAIDMYRFKDGKVIERWGNADLVAIIRQIGLPVDMTIKPLPPED